MESKIFETFTNKYLGKSVDVDGQYGSQCVDLFNKYNSDYFGIYINCQPSGYARSIAENKNNNKILKYYKETEINNMICGTVVVYGKCNFAPDSHVCFFIKDNGDGTYQSLQQNSRGRQYVTIDNNPYSGIIGAFIPNNIFSERHPEEKKETGANQILYTGSVVKFNSDIYEVKSIDVKNNTANIIIKGIEYTIPSEVLDEVKDSPRE